MRNLKSLVAASACIAAGCAMQQPRSASVAPVEIRGVVIDARTSQPISGAHVVAEWHVSSPMLIHGSAHRCPRIASAESDELGRFSMAVPAFEMLGPGWSFVDVRVLKPGWEERGDPRDPHGREYAAERHASPDIDPATAASPPARTTITTVRLYPSSADGHDRIRHLHAITQVPVDCSSFGSRGELALFHAAAATEGRSLAATRYERYLAAVLEARAKHFLDFSKAIEEERRLSIAHGASRDPADADDRDLFDKTHLMRAVMAADLPRARAWLEKGANPNRLDRDNHTALSLALEGRDGKPNMEIVRLLLAHPGIDPDRRLTSLDYTPLIRHAVRGPPEILELLLKHGANPNLRAYRKTALDYIIEAPPQARDGGLLARNAELIIKARGFDVDASLGGPSPPLHAAASQDRAAIVRLLLEAGANSELRDGWGRTALLAATTNALANRPPIGLETLRVLASSPRVRKDALLEGKTALQLAKEAGRADVLQILDERRP